MRLQKVNNSKVATLLSLPYATFKGYLFQHKGIKNQGKGFSSETRNLFLSLLVTTFPMRFPNPHFTGVCHPLTSSLSQSREEGWTSPWSTPSLHKPNPQRGMRKRIMSSLFHIHFLNSTSIKILSSNAFLPQRKQRITMELDRSIWSQLQQNSSG